MRTHTWHSVTLAGAPFKKGMHGTIWLLPAAVFALAYLIGQLGINTLVFTEGCTIALGVITLTFWETIKRLPEKVEHVLYRTEHLHRR